MNHPGHVLPEWLGRRADLTPDVPALLSSSGTWTFRQLNEAAETVARSLSSLPGLPEEALSPPPGPQADARPLPGPLPGPRVALLLSNSPQFVLWVHGLAKAGAVLLPLNTRLAPQELVWQLRDAGAVALVYDAAHAELAGAVARHIPHIQLINVSATPANGGGGAATTGGRGLRADVHLDDLHSIVYTSGTTGRPKGAMLTYGNYWWSATASALNLGVMSDDRWLACMPLFHVGGLSILLRSVIYGMPVLLHKSFDAKAVNSAIDEQRVTLLSVVATMLERMLASRGDKPYPPTLRAVLVGGGPAPKPLLERAAHLGMPVLQTYGLTEAASQVATLAPDDALRKLGSAGKPLFPTRLRIVDVQEGVEARVGAERESDAGARLGDVGEIAVAGPTVTPGYWNKAGETAAVLHDGWLHTGDLGFVDEEGYLYVVDRREDLIVSGGENVYPAEVEGILLEHADIAEAGVVGLSHARWGQAPAAVVVVRDGRRLSEAAVQAHCRERLAAYKVPTRVVFDNELPRNAAGKLLRRQLRERLQMRLVQGG